MRRVPFAVAVALAVSCAAAGAARAQSVKLGADRREIYAGLPFTLSLTARDFDESPEPEAPKLEVPGATVTYLGMSPGVSQMVSIVNGRRSESHDVTFVYRWRVVVPKAGDYGIPAVTVTQGQKHASSQAAGFRATEVEATQDMQLRVELPERPLWVGERFDITIDWYLRRDVSDRTVSVPLMDAAELEVEAPPDDGRDKLSFSAGAKELELPYERDNATLDGVQYTRFRFHARATALKAGTLELPPARVVAALQVGEGRDGFGFRVPRTKLFQAQDQARHIEIRPLPVAGRPASFANAVGTGFAIDVAADRTVVRAGDPLELTLTLRGEGRLKGLMLPDLGAEGGLPRKLFAAPDEPPAGEILEDGKAKRFVVAVRLESTEAREIPPIAFSYFDPAAGAYKTVRSRPIALQVAGAATVGAADVVRTPPRAGAPAHPSATPAPASLMGADLTLSREDKTLARALQPTDLRGALAALYGAPLALLGFTLLRRRNRRQREEQGESRRALRAVDTALDEAAAAPAREAAPRVAQTLRQLLRRLELSDEAAGDLLQRLEVEGFRPGAAAQPLAAELLAEVRTRARALGRPRPPAPTGAGTAALLLAAAIFPSSSRAAAPADGRLGEARASYMNALNETDRDRRTTAFGKAAGLLGELAAAYDDRPELLCDWGNAALGAQDLGKATLAYRRALHLDPGLARARGNLDWVRKQAPEWLPRPDRGGAIESLFFWHRSLSVARRHLIAAGAFALAILLLVPLAADPVRRRRLRRAAAVPLLVLAATAASLALERDASADAVVVGDSLVLRAADSAGAPAVLPRPLPAGAEVVVDESRQDWARVHLADGAAGWLPRSAIAHVVAQ